jgi:hypothetical protein
VSRKPQMFKTGIKAISKRSQKSLKATLTNFIEHPEDFLPVCTSDCADCPFKNLKKKLNAIKEHIDSPFWIKMHSFGFGEIEKAYLDIEELLSRGEITHTGVIPVGKENLSYVFGKRSARETLVGIEYHYKPYIHLFAFNKYMEKGYVFFVTDENLLCAGKGDKVPEEFINFIQKKLQYSFQRKDKKLFTHRGKGVILEISIGDLTLEIAKDDAKDSISTLKELAVNVGVSDAYLNRYIAYKIKIIIDNIQKVNEIAVDKDTKKEYMKGKISDKDILNYGKNEFITKFIKKKEVAFINDWISYGKNYEKFLDSLNLKPYERVALINLLKKYENPIILEGGSGTKLITMLWEDHAEELAAPIGKYDKSILPENSSEHLHALWMKKIKEEKIVDLPELDNISDNVKFLDKLIRTYKSEGSDAVKRYYQLYKGHTFHTHSMGYALFKQIHAEQEIIWTLSKDEIEHGDSMYNEIKEILSRSGKEYIASVQRFAKKYGL